MNKPVLRLFCLLTIFFYTVAPSWAVTLLGPKQYLRTTGSSDVYTDTFRGVVGQGKLTVRNGNQSGDNRITDAISSGSVFINGQEIFGPSNFNQHVFLLEAPVNLAEANSVRVELNSKPGSYITVEVTEEISPPSITFSADPGSIMAGESSSLAWSSSNADTCVIEPGIGTVDPSGSITVTPNETTTYTLTATGLGGTSQSGTTVTVLYPPTVSISADPSQIAAGESCTLSWTSSNAGACVIDPGIGAVGLSGSMDVSPAQNTTYIITATGPGGTATAQAAVNVASAQYEPQPEGSFGQRYEELIPTDATAESYDPKRFSVVTGLVRGVDGSPISGISVTVHDHPEYGTASTDAEGRFSIPIEGGTTFTVSYSKQGLISAQRQVYVPWNDIAVAETVQMISEDPKSTTFTFDGNPGSMITHQSTIIADEFGSRACSMVLTGDNRAYETDAQGNVIREIATVTTRATEFTTPDSMPAKLPPTSAYTYCAELSVDGAQRVKFQEPVITWINNFLGFEVGEPVPVGYYDRDRGVWVPSDNGVVIRLLDVNGDGIVDALDADGDGQTDDLNGNGSFTDEVQGLDDPAIYRPGDTYWRVAVTHFTPYDCNWPAGLPSGAAGPNPPGAPDADNIDQQKPDNEPCKTPTGSSVEDRGRILHEDIPIPGTDMTLHYASNRVEGYKTKITVPASGEIVPASLKCIVVQVEIAGRIFEQTLEPLPNSTAEFIWDGTDCRGKPVYGDTTALTRVGYVYDAVYYSAPDDFEMAFGAAGDTITGIGARQEVTIWTRNRISVGSKTPDSGIAEGFSLSPHHYLGLNDILYKGDGSTKKNIANAISTVAGIGVEGWEDNCPIDVKVDAEGNMYILENWGGPVVRKVDTSGVITTIWFGGDSLDVDGAGNVYIADAFECMVLKLDKNGVVTRIAGNGTAAFSGDGGPAVDASLYCPWDVAIDGAGNMYIADTYRIRKVDTSGIITTFAGNGIECWDCTGNGTPATETPIFVYDVAADAEGNIYYADYYNSCIRKVDISGIITIVAGNGTPGYSGDGGPAAAASLNSPTRVSTDPLGNLYIADSHNNRIRKVDTGGIITTIAGNGFAGCSGDGGAATSASISEPCGAVVDAAGDLYIADTWNMRVRKVARTPPLFFNAANSDEIAFAEDDGIGHVMSLDGNHKRTIDLHTGKVLREFGYDANKKLVSITDQFGNMTTINRNISGVPVSITSPYGLTTSLTINAQNRLTKITYPDSSFYSFEYTPQALMTAKVEPKGNRFERLYDSSGRVTDAIDSEGGHWSFLRTDANGDIFYQVMTGEGNVTSYLDHTYSTGAYTSIITNAGGGSTSISSSADGLTLTKSLSCGMDIISNYELDPEYGFKYVKKQSESTPSGLTKTTEWGHTYEDTDANGIPDLLTKTVTINNKTTAFADDVLQSKKTTTSPTGRTVASYYDPNTLVANSVTVPGLYDMNYEYDSRGRLTSVSSNTRQTTFTYDTQGNLESVTDPEMHTTTYEYDPMGRVTLVHRPDTSTIGYSYDANGNMTVLSNPVPVNHIFDHNGVNLLKSYETPLSGSYTYVYDKDKRLIQTIFPSGKQITNTYQDLRLTQIQTPEGNIYQDYLCSTKVGAIRKGTEEIEYGYDGSLVTSETFSGTLNQSLGYTYNNNFDVTRFSYAGGAVTYGYDNDGLLTGAGSFTITRNAANGLPEAVTGGVLNLTRSLNGYGETEGEVCKVNNRVVTSWNVTRDNAGRIMSKTETVDGVTANYAYTYDPLGRILTVTKDGTLVEEYRYDPVGTRTYEMNSLRGISGRDFDYSDEDHLLSAGTAYYWYDPDGFLETKTDGSATTGYDYSSRGELLRASLPDSKAVIYVNDPLGRRIAKNVDGVPVEKYLWQGQTRLLAVCDENDNPVMRFEYADDRMPVAMTKDGVKYYLSYDQIGSLRAVADASGNIVKRVDYDSFGNIINDTNPSFAIPFGFAGGLHDGDTGLVRFGYRDYDPDVGRWTAKDPIFFAGGDTDLYGYCLNNPVNETDANGLQSGTLPMPGTIPFFPPGPVPFQYGTPENKMLAEKISEAVQELLNKLKGEQEEKLKNTKCEVRQPDPQRPPGYDPENPPPPGPDAPLWKKISRVILDWLRI